MDESLEDFLPKENENNGNFSINPERTPKRISGCAHGGIRGENA